MDARVGPARLPAIEIRLRLLERLEAQALERRLLRVADAGFDLPLAIGIADAARQRDDAVVREHVAVERIERRVVDVRREHAFAEIVEDDDADGAAEPAKGPLVQLGPDLRARVQHEQPDRLAPVAERQDEEPRAAVLARLRVRGPSARRRSRPGLPRPGAVMITTRASGGACPRSVTTKRRTLAYRAGKPWSSTRSCQIAMALRPRPSASSISSRYGSQALALGARPGRGDRGRGRWTPRPDGRFCRQSRWTPPRMAGFDASRWTPPA